MKGKTMTITATGPAQMELTTDCTCITLDENEVEIPSNECFGCWDDELEYFKAEFLEPFLDANDLGFYDTLRLDATNYGWRRESGYAFTEARDLIKALILRGEFTLRITLSEDKRELTIVRSSHDELGARFVITPAEESEED